MIKYISNLLIASLVVTTCLAKVEVVRNIRNTDGPKIAIASVAIGKDYQKKMRPFTQIRKYYAELHGYDYISCDDLIPTCNGITTNCYRHPSWQSIPLVANHLTDYDWIFFMDADSVIMNIDQKIEAFIDEYLTPDDHFATCNECYQKSGDIIAQTTPFCAGLWIIKNDPISFMYLTDVWKHGEGKRTCREANWEQPSMNSIMSAYLTEGKPFNPKIFTGNAFNTSVNQYQDGDFIVHLYAYHGKEEAEAIKNLTMLFKKRYPAQSEQIFN